MNSSDYVSHVSEFPTVITSARVSPIIEALPVIKIFDSGQIYSGRAYRDCAASAHAHRVPMLFARRGMRWMSGDGLTIDILAPSVPFLVDTGDDVNENSIVAMVRFGRFRELFMGDAGEASESRLLADRDAPSILNGTWKPPAVTRAN